MKVEFKGRNMNIVMTITLKQLDTIRAALDSCALAHDESGYAFGGESIAYADAPKFEKLLDEAIIKAIEKSK